MIQKLLPFDLHSCLLLAKTAMQTPDLSDTLLSQLAAQSRFAPSMAAADAPSMEYPHGGLMLTVLLYAAGACYWRLGDNTENSARIISTLGALLYAFLFLGVLNSIFVQPLVASERQVFYREKAAGMYSVHAWYLAMVRPSDHLQPKNLQ